MTSSPPLTFDYSVLRNQVINVYRRAAGTRPDVLHVKIDQKDYVIKDYSACGGLFGHLLGALFVFREKLALRQLASLDGVPAVYGCSSRRVLITSYSDAVTASKLTSKVDWQVFEPRLHSLIEQMHQSGIAHCDLRSPGNILIDNNNSPFIVDFVACIRRANKWNLPWNFLFKQACQTDFSAILKLKRRLASDALTSAETARLVNDANKGKLFRRLSSKIRSLTRWVFAAGKH